MTRKTLLQKGAAVGALATLGVLNVEKAFASAANPQLLNAFVTLGWDTSHVNGYPVFKIRTDFPAQVRVRLKNLHAGTTVISGWNNTKSNMVSPGVFANTHTAEVAGLTSSGPSAIDGFGNSYSYQIELRSPSGANQHIDAATFVIRDWFFNRGATSSYTVGFGSCHNNGFPSLSQYNSGGRGSDVGLPAFQSIGSLSFSGYIHMGDFGYPDNAGGVVAQQYEESATQVGYKEGQFYQQLHPDWKDISDHMFVVHATDDHDYGADGAFRTSGTPVIPGTSTFAGNVGGPCKDYGMEASEGCWPLQPWGSLATPGISYRQFALGAADYFLLDNRRFADPQGVDQNGVTYFENGLWYSQLGSTQRTWLENGLAASTASVKVIVAPQCMHYRWSLGERKEILEYIFNNVSGKVLIMSGDLHGQAHLRWRPTGFLKNTPVDELLVSPIHNTQADMTSNANHDTQYPASYGFTRMYPGVLPTGGALGQFYGQVGFRLSGGVYGASCFIMDGSQPIGSQQVYSMVI